jgi:hypothetical protein
MQLLLASPGSSLIPLKRHLRQILPDVEKVSLVSSYEQAKNIVSEFSGQVIQSKPHIMLRRLTLPIPPTLSEVVGDEVNLAPLVLMIREGLANERQLPPTHPYLRNVLEAEDPFGQQRTILSGDPDHTHPFRTKNIYTSLMQSHFCGHVSINNGLVATDPHFISNFIVYMGTGQGSQTADFVQSLPWFTTFHAFTAHFDHSMVNVKCTNERVWGAPSKDLKYTSSTADKFQICFTDGFNRSWTQFLAGNRTWTAARNFAKNTQIKGFASGLTPMQFANNLAILGICKPPSSEEMADVLRLKDHRNKGAVKGLVYLKLLPDTDSVDKMEIQQALETLHTHFTNHLSEDDKSLIDYERVPFIIIEHLLCKVIRWRDALIPPLPRVSAAKRKRQLPPPARPTPQSELIVLSLPLHEMEFKPKLNLTDQFALPFPLFLDQETPLDGEEGVECMG